jgi:hypothetical protein
MAYKSLSRFSLSTRIRNLEKSDLGLVNPDILSEYMEKWNIKNKVSLFFENLVKNDFLNDRNADYFTCRPLFIYDISNSTS